MKRYLLRLKISRPNGCAGSTPARGTNTFKGFARKQKSICPFVRGRRAWLFSDTPAGANASAMIYSMVETAKANGHEPHSWLNHVMRELPKAREMKSYDHLLPWNLNAADLIRDAYLREAPSWWCAYREDHHGVSFSP